MFLKLIDETMYRSRLGWAPILDDTDLPLPDKPTFSAQYKAIVAKPDLTAYAEDAPEATKRVVNQKEMLQADCSISPSAYAEHQYSALVAVNPALLEVAEVSYAQIYLPGTKRTRPTFHLRFLKSFDLRNLEWLCSIHLID